jgi:hypothetical protein
MLAKNYAKTSIYVMVKMMLNIGLRTRISRINGLKAKNPPILAIRVLNISIQAVQNVLDHYNLLQKARAVTLPFILHHLPFTIKNRTNGTVIKISFLNREESL